MKEKDYSIVLIVIIILGIPFLIVWFALFADKYSTKLTPEQIELINNPYDYTDMFGNKGIAKHCEYYSGGFASGGTGIITCNLKDGTTIQASSFKNRGGIE